MVSDATVAVVVVVVVSEASIKVVVTVMVTTLGGGGPVQGEVTVTVTVPEPMEGQVDGSIVVVVVTVSVSKDGTVTVDTWTGHVDGVRVTVHITVVGTQSSPPPALHIPTNPKSNVKIETSRILPLNGRCISRERCLGVVKGSYI
jgi:hypothetical protein